MRERGREPEEEGMTEWQRQGETVDRGNGRDRGMTGDRK